MYHLFIQFTKRDWESALRVGVEKLIKGTLLELCLPPDEFTIEGTTVKCKESLYIN